MKLQLVDAVLAPNNLCTVTSCWPSEDNIDYTTYPWYALPKQADTKTDMIEKLTRELQDADMQLGDYKHALNNFVKEMEHANKEREFYKNHCRILLKKIDRIKKGCISDTKTECDNLFKCWEDEVRARNIVDRKYSKLLHTIESLINRYTDENEATQFNSDTESKNKWTVLQNILIVLRYLKNKANNQK